MVNIDGSSFIATRHIIAFKSRLDHHTFVSRSKRLRGVIHPEMLGDDRRTPTLPEARQLNPSKNLSRLNSTHQNNIVVCRIIDQLFHVNIFFYSETPIGIGMNLTFRTAKESLFVDPSNHNISF